MAGAGHLQALRRLPGKRVVGILDTKLGRAAALAERFGRPRAFTDRERFYQEIGPQVVHVVTPPDAHQEIALDALARGIHVIVEKPPALTVAGCQLLQDQANRSGVTIGVNENTVHESLVLRACRAIAAGRIGRLVHIDGFFSFGLDGNETRPRWMDWLPGGMVEDLLPHPLTIARALTGHRLMPEYWHRASTGRVAGQNHDELRLVMAGDDGVTVSLAISLTARPVALSFVARGTDGLLEVDLRNRLFWLSHSHPGGAIVRHAEIVRAAFAALCQTASNAAGLLTGHRERYGSSLHLLRAHYAALEAGHEIPAPLARAIETVEIIRTIWPC
jgi:predicted dehydrogenase